MVLLADVEIFLMPDDSGSFCLCFRGGDRCGSTGGLIDLLWWSLLYLSLLLRMLPFSSHSSLSLLSSLVFRLIISAPAVELLDDELAC